MEEEAARKAALEKSKKEKEESESVAETAISKIRKEHDDEMKKIREEHSNITKESKPRVAVQDPIPEPKPPNSRSLAITTSEENHLYKTKSSEDSQLGVDSGCGCFIS